MIIFIYLLSITYANKRALLIIDVQNDFVANGSLAVPEGEKIIPNVNTLRNTNYFDLIVRSQDWHPKNHISFASNHVGEDPFNIITLNYTEEGKVCGYTSQYPDHSVDCTSADDVKHIVSQTLWPNHCEQGSHGAEFVSSMKVESSDKVVQKGFNSWIDSYSAFYDNGHFTHTNLNSILTEAKIDEVYVVGLALDFCVFYTTRDAKQLGYATYLIEDATKGISDVNSKTAIDTLKNLGVKIINTNSIPSEDSGDKEIDWMRIGCGIGAAAIVACLICMCFRRQRNTYPQKKSSDAMAVNYVPVTDP